MMLSAARARVWIGAALRQVVPVIGVCLLGWEPVLVLLFYWLDAALRIRRWLAFERDGSLMHEPNDTPEQRRRVGNALAVFATLPLLAVTLAIVGLLIHAGQDGIDLLRRAVPSTLLDAAMLVAAIAIQVITSVRKLHVRQPIPADREAFKEESAFRLALLFMRTLLLAPIVIIAIAAPDIAQVAVIALAMALTVYDANPHLFLRMMEKLFESGPERP
jgi:hypothetical protein